MAFKSKFFKSIFSIIICGVPVSLATGVIENPPEASIVGAKYYGHPLVWRITMITLNISTRFTFTNLVLDTLFWVSIFFVAFVIVKYFRRIVNLFRYQ